eukprot:9819773-Prorocentrum_lima.AAC.1
MFEYNGSSKGTQGGQALQQGRLIWMILRKSNYCWRNCRVSCTTKKATTGKATRLASPSRWRYQRGRRGQR